MAHERILLGPSVLYPHRVVLLRDPENGIERAAAVITDVERGPGLGGTREGQWQSDGAMLTDCLRLAYGMRLKNLYNDLPFGGGKACIELTETAVVESAYLRFGELVRSLGGALVTTEDAGTDPAKMRVMHRAAPGLVLGRPPEDGGCGDPSPFTAVGLVKAIEAVSAALGCPGLDGLEVYVSGCGHVGSRVVELLSAGGARTLIADLHPTCLAPLRDLPGVRVVAADAAVTADVFAPCALGGVVGAGFPHTVKAVCGAANNQLTSDDVAVDLHRRGILYVPDWAANGGGLIRVAAERLGKSEGWALDRARGIGVKTGALLEEARARGAPPLHVAHDWCERAARALPSSRTLPTDHANSEEEMRP